MKFVSPLAGFCLLLSASAAVADSPFDLLNGTVVEDGYFEEVVRIRSSEGSCTATIVGPQVVLTAGHCGKQGDDITFSRGGRSYAGTMTHSPGWTGKVGSHDVAVVLLKDRVRGIAPASIGGEYEEGADVLLLGYGCSVNGKTKPDGKLRMGYSRIIGKRESGFVAKKSGGAAGCYGDSGGPSFMEDDDGNRYVFGVHSAANIKDLTFDMRTDVKETQDFLESFAKKNKVDICGLTTNCARLKSKPKK